jgi:hypothetical protein
MGKSEHMNRKETEGPEIMEAYEDNIHIFDQVGWYMFFTKLDGYPHGVSCEFFEVFDR